MFDNNEFKELDAKMRQLAVIPHLEREIAVLRDKYEADMRVK